jgi:hypothetical protein
VIVLKNSVFAIGHWEELSFFQLTNLTSIEEAKIVLFDFNNFSLASTEYLQNLIFSGKEIYIDSTYELIEESVLLKIQKLTNIQQVRYFYNPRSNSNLSNLLNDLSSKGLKCFPAQYFIDYAERYTPVVNGVMPAKDFLCLTGKITSERTYLISLLSKFNLLDSGYVSFFNTESVDQTFDSSSIYDSYRSNLSEPAKQIIKDEISKIKLPLIVDQPLLTKDLSHSKLFNASLYAAVDFVIVPETKGSLKYNEFFVTEKTIKCILTNKKFIPVGSQYFLKNLKDYYLTHHNRDISALVDWYDDSFDSIQTAEKRIEQIVNIVKDTVESKSQNNKINC